MHMFLFDSAIPAAAGAYLTHPVKCDTILFVCMHADWFPLLEIQVGKHFQ